MHKCFVTLASQHCRCVSQHEVQFGTDQADGLFGRLDCLVCRQRLLRVCCCRTCHTLSTYGIWLDLVI
jgi:hypothetical protein